MFRQFLQLIDSMPAIGQSLRYDVLKKYGSTCMRCGGTEAIAVDHVYPRSTHPELQLEFANMQVLCRVCNSKKGATYADYRPVSPSALISTEGLVDTWSGGQ